MAIDHPQTTLAQQQPDTANIADWLFSQWRQWVALQWLRIQIQRERRQLRYLPESILQDIGIDRNDALIESKRGYSDVPEHRAKELTEGLSDHPHWYEIHRQRFQQGS